MPPKIKINIKTKTIKTKLKKKVNNITKSIIPTNMPNNLNVIKEVVKGRNNYPTKVIKILSQYGTEPITGYIIKRTPVSKILTTALNIASKGEFNKKLETTDYDKLYHLYLEFTLQSGKKIVVEKNEVINMMISTRRPKEEIKVISSYPRNLNINTIMRNTQNAMGANFFIYDASKNNCQDFIVNILRSNGIGNDLDISFIKQNTTFLFNSNLRKISNTTTTIGARIDSIKNLI
jgi:hypothetical protein